MYTLLATQHIENANKSTKCDKTHIEMLIGIINATAVVECLHKPAVVVALAACDDLTYTQTSPRVFQALISRSFSTVLTGEHIWTLVTYF